VTCPICGEEGGFHDENIHASRPLPEGKALPLIDVSPPCRACGEPVDGPGAPGCRYPNHKEVEL
jgi:hypothetical protein